MTMRRPVVLILLNTMPLFQLTQKSQPPHPMKYYVTILFENFEAGMWAY
jgi:hypothetical protein